MMKQPREGRGAKGEGGWSTGPDIEEGFLHRARLGPMICTYVEDCLWRSRQLFNLIARCYGTARLVSPYTRV